ncbi:11085_t:CDS:2 [Paraglomus occultum]|uniref:11085_t:CDS:1 n=1 Tax=Paraglomus occultum TaxID=144539 RepID=A0A9N9GIH8_9GLOM|nr:11085_t:CDS:2 [Paraglomus occultum]
MIDIRRGLSVPQLKEKFIQIYGDGTDPNKKYFPQELYLMRNQLLPAIAACETLDAEYQGYKRRLDTIINSLFNLEKQGLIVKAALTQISNFRKLSPIEDQELNDITDFLDNPEAPTTELTARKLKRVLANSSLGDAEVTKWQTTQRFQDKIAIENLVRDYRPGASEPSQKASLINTMKAYRDADNQALDLTQYWDDETDDSKVVAGIKKFLYEEADGKAHQLATQGPTGPETPTPTTESGHWEKYKLWYIAGGTIVLTGIAIAIVF